MSQLLLCSSPVASSSIENTFGFSSDTITGVGCVNPNTLSAYRPYLATDSTPTSQDLAVLTQFSNTAVTKELTEMSLCYGVDNTLALAEISEKLKNSSIGLMGASSSIYTNRLSSFTDSVKNYQSALMNYRDVMKSGTANKVMAKQNVVRAFDKMQIGFKQELSSVSAGIKASQKANPLTNSTRAMNIAKSSRTAVKLEVSNQVQASQLARFGKHAKFLGNGIVLLNVAERVGNIHNSYTAGENWERKLFIESSSFALSTITGAVALKAGLSLLIIATPVGWIGLVVGGLAVAGVAAGASFGMNTAISNNSGDWYDSIMKLVSK